MASVFSVLIVCKSTFATAAGLFNFFGVVLGFGFCNQLYNLFLKISI
jgi:hypothetical protein